MKKLLVFLAFVLCPFAAQAQTPGGQPEFCVTSPTQTANYNQLCISASSSGGTIGVTNFGSATGVLNVTSAINIAHGNLTSATALAVGSLPVTAWWLSSNPLASFYATTSDASVVLNDFEVVVSGHNAGNNVDNAALRSSAQVNVGAYNSSSGVTWLRAAEFQVSLGTGTAYGAGNEKSVEIGLHTQVAGNGTTALSGAQIYCSHTGWLPSGLRCDSALYIFGEDGWSYGLYYVGTDSATVLSSIDQNGTAFFRGISSTGGNNIITRDGTEANAQFTIQGLTNSNKQLLFGFDTTLNVGFVEAIFMGTSYEPLALNPASAGAGGVAVGSSADPGAGALLLRPQAFSALTACSSTIKGALAMVNDSNTVTWGANIAGSSTNQVLAFCDGTSWTVAAK